MSIPLVKPAVSSDEDLIDEINHLRTLRNAVILAHYYQDGKIQDLADFVGDSLDLSRRAAATKADVIAFCGVKFMAEVAKILNPEKTVILPDLQAGCSLEDSCPVDEFAAFRNQYPDHICLTYINCSAAVKAHSDIIVTSSNEKHIINQIPENQAILMAPDQHLGRYLVRQSGRDMVLWPGSCIVHEQFSEKGLIDLKTDYPDAQIVAHPECPDHILHYAHHVGSTSSILKFVLSHEANTFIIATEPGIIHQMQKHSPHKKFIGVPGFDGDCDCNRCPFMALNSLEKLRNCLRDMTPAIHIGESDRLAAKKPLDRMMNLSPPSPQNGSGKISGRAY